MIIVIETALSEEDQAFLEQSILGPNFPWWYSSSATYEDQYNLTGDYSFFRHLFVWEMHKTSQHAHIIRSRFSWLFRAIGSDPWQVRANMMTVKEGRLCTRKHVDSLEKHIVAIYYVNDTDGNTVFYDGERELSVSPQKGKLVLFDGNTEHSANYPQTKDRAVINFIFFADKSVSDVADLISNAAET